MRVYTTGSGGTGSGSGVTELMVVIDGQGLAIEAGATGYFPIAYGATINSWTLVAKETGSMVLDVWKDTYANFPPTVADTIAGSEKPTLSSANKNQDTSLSSWTTTVTAGDIIAVTVESSSTVTWACLIIKMTQT